MVSPVAWRDDICMKCFEVIIRRQREDMDVGDIKSVLEESSLLLQAQFRANGNAETRGFLEVLESTEEQMKLYQQAQEAMMNSKKEEEGSGAEETLPSSPSSSAVSTNVKQKPFIPELTAETLSFLESFHKILVFYMWMVFRNSVVYSDQETTEDLKKRVELALDWALQVIGYSRKNTTEKNHKGQWKGKGKLGRGEVFNERASIKQLVEDYERRNIREERKERSVWSDGVRDEGSRSGEIEVMDFSEMRAKVKRAWVQAPDLTTLLKNYVEDPSLRVGRNSSATMEAAGSARSMKGNGKGKARL